MSAERVIIIGGGVIGVTAAYYMQQAGMNVTVIDRGKIGGACSHGNCGLVTPSHVLPLAEPGLLPAGLAALFSRNSPLKIRPGLNVDLWLWLRRFAKRCNEHDMLQAAAGISALLESSRQLYDDLIATEQLSCEWQSKGVLFVFKTQKKFAAYAETDAIQTRFGQPAQRMERDELLAFEPSLRDDVAGGWYYPGDAFLRPDRLMSAWRVLLESRGVRFCEDTEMKSISGTDRQARAIRTSGEELVGDHFVCCAGAWSPMLQSELGTKIPIQPGKGYSMTMAKPDDAPKVAMLLPEHRVAVTPMQSGFRLGSIMELAGYDTTLRPERLKLLTDGAANYLRTPVQGDIEERWYGWRPMTFDSMPIIDRVPRWDNVWIAAGHSMLGLSMAPATGKLVAELVTGQAPHIEGSPYRLNRF